MTCLYSTCHEQPDTFIFIYDDEGRADIAF